MSGKAKPNPIEAFVLNIADARWLVETARVLENQRARRMRKELRTRIGAALKLAARDHEQLDCFESNDLFVVIKPGASIGRDHVKNLDPLLRQSVVASCAALETYVADAVATRVSSVVRAKAALPSRLAGLPLTVGDWKDIEDSYKYRRRGLRERVLVPSIREMSSTAPGQVGQLVSMVGLDDWAKKVDSKRGVSRGTTHYELTALTKRRNRIAHEGDRVGYGRSHISPQEATGYIDLVDGVVRALEALLSPDPGGTD